MSSKHYQDEICKESDGPYPQHKFRNQEWAELRQGHQDLFWVRPCFKNVVFLRKKDRQDYCFVGNFGQDYSEHWKEKGQICILEKDGSIVKFDAAYSTIKDLFKVANHPALSIRFARPNSTCEYEVFVDMFGVEDIPPLKIEVEQAPNFLWLIPSSAVYYCKQKKLYKQVWTFNYGIY